MFGHDIVAFRLDAQVGEIRLSENTQFGYTRKALGLRRIRLSDTGIIKSSNHQIMSGTNIVSKIPEMRQSTAWIMNHCLILEFVYSYIFWPLAYPNASPWNDC